MSFNNLGKPKDTQVISTLNATEILLEGNGYFGAFVQVRANGGAYSNTREVAVYRVDNGTPAVNSGFYLGDGDYREFSPGELKNGVKFLTGEVGVEGQLIVQYYAGH